MDFARYSVSVASTKPVEERCRLRKGFVTGGGARRGLPLSVARSKVTVRAKQAGDKIKDAFKK